jgi:DNA-binding response OmpR family regulator
MTRPLILLADDDPEMRNVIRRGLAPLDAELLEARDGEEALGRIIEEEPDLVVLDVMMPGLSGWEICKYVRSKPEYAGIKVLMLTGIGQTVNEMTSPLYGADAYLDKPVDIGELVSTVRSLLESVPA